MTDRVSLQAGLLIRLRSHGALLRDNVAAWQLLFKAAEEIERLQRELDAQSARNIDKE